MKIIVAVMLACAIASCAQMPNNYITQNTINKNSGLLLVRLKSDWPSKKSFYHADLQIFYKRVGSLNPMHKALTFKEADFLALIELKEGEYEFSKLTISDLYLPLENDGFTIEKNKITYIGDIYASTEVKGRDATIFVEDNFSNTIKLLKSQDPSTLNRYKVTKSINYIRL